jgi:hypothetical protein
MDNIKMGLMKAKTAVYDFVVGFEVLTAVIMIKIVLLCIS